MTLTVWLSLVVICCFGAISPGPSLAVVLRHTVVNGRLHGIFTAISHAAGVGLWALLTIWGLALLVTESPFIYQIITWAGAAYLAWMGWKAIRSTGGSQLNLNATKAPLMNAARDGLMISLLNPKLAVFFLALFSQFISAEQTLTDQMIMLATVAGIDGLWYCIVAIVLSHSGIMDKLQQRSALIDKISGAIFILLAVRVVTL
ncbi:LysE family translocator [Oceanospirillum sediminis]|uniref:LysE family translocator n=1 Tax=Oceanospirillum sediminis TaxID=2760088 RepID=A0A839ILY9_9GAMM|nr:LysE family translocator [Oceanospirillum sediminis]MBB1486245.1 LysE family translocator [Oceanospirillum sediminis]